MTTPGLTPPYPDGWTPSSGCARCGGTGVVPTTYDPTTGRWNSDDCPNCDGGRA